MHALSHALVKVLDAPTSSYAGDVEIETNENLAPAVKEVERYLSADRLVPSYHNVVTVAGIEVRFASFPLPNRRTEPMSGSRSSCSSLRSRV